MFMNKKPLAVVSALASCWRRRTNFDLKSNSAWSREGGDFLAKMVESSQYSTVATPT